MHMGRMEGPAKSSARTPPPPPAPFPHTTGMPRHGQAMALTPGHWRLWLDWVKEHCGPKVWFVLFLTGALGLRCGEAVALKRQDVVLEGTVPKVRVTGDVKGARKSPGDVYIRKQHLKIMKEVLKNGITTMVTKRHKHGTGKLKTIITKAHFKVPEEGFIFKGAGKAGHMTYHAVYQHVVRQAPNFVKHLDTLGKPVSNGGAKLRPHSGRATLITELMGEGLALSMSMKYARHAPGSLKVHLKYGQLTLSDVKKACDALETSRKRTRWSQMSLKELLAAQKAVARELAKRMLV